MGTNIVSPKMKTYTTVLSKQFRNLGFSLSELTTSAGLNDDDLGFILKMAAVSIVESLEYGVVV